MLSFVCRVLVVGLLWSLYCLNCLGVRRDRMFLFCLVLRRVILECLFGVSWWLVLFFNVFDVLFINLL